MAIRRSAGSACLSSHSQPVRQARGQSGGDDAALRRVDGVGDAPEHQRRAFRRRRSRTRRAGRRRAAGRPSRDSPRTAAPSLQRDRRVGVSPSGTNPPNVSPVGLEDDRQVRVAEQAELALARLERPLRVLGVEDVVVLVERRAVADLDAVVDHDGPGRQRPGGTRGSRGQRLAGPHRRVPRHLLKLLASSMPQAALSWLPRMIATGFERADAVDDGVGLAAVADEIAEDEQRDPTRPRRRRAPRRARRGWRGCPRGSGSAVMRRRATAVRAPSASMPSMMRSAISSARGRARRRAGARARRRLARREQPFHLRAVGRQRTPPVGGQPREHVIERHVEPDRQAVAG